MKRFDLCIIGAGPAGMAAALGAFEKGIRNIAIFERAEKSGGILNQCIHNGFGLHRFGEELTGPEYAYRYKSELDKTDVKVFYNANVTNITRDKILTVISPDFGVEKIEAKAIVLAMGCRERPRGALNIAGTRPAGIYSAGTAQRFVNINGYMPGKNIVILGSGDIGLIMARRMTLEGANVKAVLELMPYSSGLARNIAQCLDDFNIPLKLSHTVVEIHGKDRVEGVTVAKVGPGLVPDMNDTEYIECDTLLLSCGLIPENELTKSAGISLDRVTGGAVVSENRETEVEGIFACGNVLHVHDLVDFVSEEAKIAGESAAEYIMGGEARNNEITLDRGDFVRYTVPQKINKIADTDVYFRVADTLRDVKLVAESNGEILFEKKEKRVAPGEMVKIRLKKEAFEKANGSIRVSVLTGEAAK